MLDGPLLLKDIERLPARFLALLAQRCPGWRFDRAEDYATPTLMNHCRQCGAALTDFYTHAAPGAAFYPTRPEDCWNITAFALPVTEDVPLDTTFSVGGLTEWLELSKAEPWEALPVASG
jgi:hypothetical protein